MPGTELDPGAVMRDTMTKLCVLGAPRLVGETDMNQTVRAQITEAFLECLLHARHISKHLTDVSSVNLYSSSKR